MLVATILVLAMHEPAGYALSREEAFRLVDVDRRHSFPKVQPCTLDSLMASERQTVRASTHPPPSCRISQPLYSLVVLVLERPLNSLAPITSMPFSEAPPTAEHHLTTMSLTNSSISLFLPFFLDTHPALDTLDTVSKGFNQNVKGCRENIACVGCIGCCRCLGCVGCVGCVNCIGCVGCVGVCYGFTSAGVVLGIGCVGCFLSAAVALSIASFATMLMVQCAFCYQCMLCGWVGLCGKGRLLFSCYRCKNCVRCAHCQNCVGCMQCKRCSQCEQLVNANARRNVNCVDAGGQA